MIKTVLPTVFVVCFFHILLLSSTYGIDEAGDLPCENYTTAEDCCKPTTLCRFVNCTANGTITSMCQNNTGDVTEGCNEICVGGSNTSTSTPTTSEPTTPPPPATTNCTSLNATMCCKKDCIFVKCTDFVGCQEKNFSKTGCVDQCHVTPTTPSASTKSSPTESPTTPSIQSTSVNDTKSTTTSAPHRAGAQHFDGPSFIGGIVLCAGIVIVIFVAWKFYKARQERNYHHLH